MCEHVVDALNVKEAYNKYGAIAYNIGNASYAWFYFIINNLVIFFHF